MESGPLPLGRTYLDVGNAVGNNIFTNEKGLKPCDLSPCFYCGGDDET